MAETDWTLLNNSQDANTVARGVTAGAVKPNSAVTNSFVYGFNSLLATEGAIGWYCNRANFAPMQNDGAAATGGSIRGCVKRGTSSAPQTGFAPMLFINLKSGLSASPAVEDTGYLLGLEDSDPHRVVLAKRAPRAGLTVTTSDKSIMRVSSVSFPPDTWLHLRLDAIFNQNGDVVLRCFRNDLALNTIQAPNWQPIPGMDDFIDDAIAVNTGSTPLKGGFAGFAFFSKDLQKRAYFDHLEVLRQKVS